MTEQQLIEKMARIWVNSGGNERSFNWCWQSIKKEIENIIKQPYELNIKPELN